MTSYHSPPDTYKHPSVSSSDTYGAPSSTYGAPSDVYGAPSDTYGAPESPVSISQPQYNGHYTYDENLTPSAQINYYDSKK